MPSAPLSKMDTENAGELGLLALRVDPDDSDEEEFLEKLFLGACDELGQRFIQEIGPQRLSLDRLEREFAERVTDGDMSWNIYSRFGFRTVADLRRVVDAFEMPAGVRTHGEHLFDGEECALLMLRRFRSADPLLQLTWETGKDFHNQ